MPRKPRQTATTMLVEQLTRYGTMYTSAGALDLAQRLHGCASRSGSGKYCYLARLCPACNTRMQRIRWDNRYGKFTAAMIHAGATPLVVRIRPEAGLSLRDGLGDVRRHLAHFILPMSSSYSRRRSHPLTHAVLAGTHGEAVKQTATGYDICAVIMLWVRPGSVTDIAAVLDLLRVHGRAQDIPCNQLEIELITSSAQKPIVEAIREVLDLTSGAWAFTAPADAVLAYSMLAGVRRTEWFGLPATQLDRVVAPLDPRVIQSGIPEVTGTLAGKASAHHSVRATPRSRSASAPTHPKPPSPPRSCSHMPGPNSGKAPSLAVNLSRQLAPQNFTEWWPGRYWDELCDWIEFEHSCLVGWCVNMDLKIEDALTEHAA